MCNPACVSTPVSVQTDYHASPVQSLYRQITMHLLSSLCTDRLPCVSCPVSVQTDYHASPVQSLYRQNTMRLLSSLRTGRLPCISCPVSVQIDYQASPVQFLQRLPPLQFLQEELLKLGQRRNLQGVVGVLGVVRVNWRQHRGDYRTEGRLLNRVAITEQRGDYRIEG